MQNQNYFERSTVTMYALTCLNWPQEVGLYFLWLMFSARHVLKNHGSSITEHRQNKGKGTSKKRWNTQTLLVTELSFFKCCGQLNSQLRPIIYFFSTGTNHQSPAVARELWINICLPVYSLKHCWLICTLIIIISAQTFRVWKQQKEEERK